MPQPGSVQRVATVQAHPRLWESVRKVNAKRVQLTPRKQELLGNFRLSVMGKVRRAPNVVLRPQVLPLNFHCSVAASRPGAPRTWITSLLKLQEADPTLDIAAVAPTSASAWRPALCVCVLPQLARCESTTPWRLSGVSWPGQRPMP